MRDIRFRGKRIDNGEWVEGCYVFDMEKHFILCKEKASDYRIAWFEVDPETVGQFTGLKDRNGKDIYEGDYIRIGCHVYQVCWSEVELRYMLLHAQGSNTYFPTAMQGEIIGNIHDKQRDDVPNGNNPS